MAKPRRSSALRRIGGTGIGGNDIEPPDVPPLDPDEIRQRHLLAEAVLVSFRATPNPVAPFGRAGLEWDITMPTTVIPGVNVEVHLAGDGDQIVEPQGSRTVAPYVDTTYGISLRAPLASRHLGTVSLTVDLGACELVNTAPGVFIALVKGEANRAFPGGGPITFRGTGSSVDIGYNSFVVDMPLEADVPNWFNADVDVTMGFGISSQNGQVRVNHNLADTKVSFGTGSSIASVGCSELVEKAIEETCDGFLSGFIGPVVANRLLGTIVRNVAENRDRLNQRVPHPPVPYKFYDLTLSAAEGLTYRYCAGQDLGLHPGEGSIGPIHP